MKHGISTFLAGLLFALGLGLSGMTNADKVIGFLNLAGDWDPSLAFVMVGAIAVHSLSYRFIVKRPSPLFTADFQIPGRRPVGGRLLLGAALFGVGWGVGGFCPGPGIVSSSTLSLPAVVFVATMLVGMIGVEWGLPRRQESELQPASPEASQEPSATPELSP